MPRVYVKKARKDYPEVGVEKGQTYYSWWSRPGGRGRGILHRSATYPKPWELTSSPFLQEQYRLDYDIGEFSVDSEEDLESTIEDFKSRIEDLRDQAQESLDNMPDELRDTSSSGELLQERVDYCEEWISNLEGVEIPEREDEQTDDDWATALDVFADEVQQCVYPG